MRRRCVKGQWSGVRGDEEALMSDGNAFNCNKEVVN